MASPTPKPSPQIPLAKTPTTTILSYSRLFLGTSFLLAPQLTASLFQFPIPASMAILARMFGIRDVVLGDLLLTAETEREKKRLLLGNMLVDLGDLAVVLWALGQGRMGVVPAGVIGGGAAVFVGLGLAGWKGF